MNIHRNWKRLSLAGVLCLGLSVAGCTAPAPGGEGDAADWDNGPAMNTEGDPKQGGTLRVIGDADLDSFDVTSANSFTAAQIQAATTRQLFTYVGAESFDEAALPAPDLAQEIPTIENGGISDDGLTYTISMKSGAKWSNGTEIQPADVERGFKRLCNPADPSPSPTYFTLTIEGMDAFCSDFLQVDPSIDNIEEYMNSRDIDGISVSESEIKFTLLQPASDFINILAIQFASAIPAEYLRYLPGSRELADNLISAGPYQIDQYTPGSSLTLTQNPEWDQNTDDVRHQYLDGIEVTLGVSPDSAAQQIEAGTQDVLWDAPLAGQELQKLIQTRDERLGLFPSGEVRPYVALNIQSPNNDGALADIRVREAISAAIDKVAIQQIFGGPSAATIQDRFIPPGSAGYVESSDADGAAAARGDADLCRSILDEAGLGGQDLTLQDLERSDSAFSAAAQSIQQDLAECGISTEITTVPLADYYDKYLTSNDATSAGEWDISLAAWSPYWAGNNGRTLIQPLFDSRSYAPGSYNYAGYEDEAVDAAIDEALTADSPEEAGEAWREADRLIVEENMWAIPLLAQNRGLVRSDRAHNALYNPGVSFYDWTQLWVE